MSTRFSSTRSGLSAGFDELEDDCPSLTTATSRSSVDDIDTDMDSYCIESFREQEYPQLKDKVYLDHAGTTLYSKSLIDAWSSEMTSSLYGNPHSESTPSHVAGQRVDIVREEALRFFNADPKYWDLVFVLNATAAIKLVGDCMRDNAASRKNPFWYGYHKDAHTSLVGVRELAGKSHTFVNDVEVDRWISKGCQTSRAQKRMGLFAYPGQSNMTGRRLPLRWCDQIRRARGDNEVYTLLDAAALASTAPLDLTDPTSAPDFVALSFYKIFGWPNLGALLVQKRSAFVLQRRKYFGGGTVDMVTTIGDNWHAKKISSVHDRLEDGTLPFHSIFALGHAIAVHKRLYGDDCMKNISAHASQLGRKMFYGLKSLRHSNGRPMVHFYNDGNFNYGRAADQGATVAMNVVRADNSIVGYSNLEAAADAQGIYVRSGALCNPGGVATYLDWSPQEMKAAFNEGHHCSHPSQVVFGKATGVVRASMGAMSSAADVDAFIEFVQTRYIDTLAKPADGPIVQAPVSLFKGSKSSLKSNDKQETKWRAAFVKLKVNMS